MVQNRVLKGVEMGFTGVYREVKFTAMMQHSWGQGFRERTFSRESDIFKEIGRTSVS